MPYTRVNWADGVGGATPMDAANLNVMDAEIAVLDTAINGSQTPSESATPAASGSVATLLGFIASQIKLITGGTHWYSAPAATLASLLSSVSSLSSGKVNKSGDTMTGGLTVVAPPVLASGNQETGFCSYYSDSAQSGKFYGSSINFKTQLTNNPSSLSISLTLRNSGASSVFADVHSIYGFRFIAQSSVNGTTDVAGQYSTNGNCLLAVDATAQTFDQHCDVCGAIHRQQPLTALDTHAGYAPGALSYVCPDCGAIESYNIRMSGADEADATPQGAGEYATTRGAQAVMIRALLRLLGLPLAD